MKFDKPISQINPSGMSFFSRRILSGLRVLFLFCLWVVPAGWLLLSLWMVTGIMRNSYPALLQWYGRNWPTAYETKQIAGSCFTSGWYNWIRAHDLLLILPLSVLLLVYLASARFVWRFLERFLGELRRALRFMTGSFRDCTVRERWVLLALFGGITAYRLYFFAVITPHTDEVCSYLYFIRQGLFITATSYPTTNNHILFNLLCSLLDKVHVLSPILLMRLPNLVGDLILFYGVFCLFRRLGGFQRAVTVVAGTAFCNMIAYYAVLGRGYQWQDLFVVVSSLGCWAYFFSRDWRGRSGMALFVMTSVAGFYISPIFIYHFLALVLLFFYVFLVRKEYKGMVVFVRALLVIVLVVAVLYLPLLLGSSPAAFTQNEYLKGAGSWSELAGQFFVIIYDLKFDLYYGTPGMYLFFVCVGFCFYLYLSGRIGGDGGIGGSGGTGGDFYYFASGYFWSVLLSVAILVLVKKVYPLERTMCFWVLAVNVFFVNACYDAIKNYAAGGGSFAAGRGLAGPGLGGPRLKGPGLTGGVSPGLALGRKAMVLIGVFLVLKIGGSVRGLFWDRFALRNTVQVAAYQVARKDFEELDRLHPDTWQLSGPHDYYSLWGRFYLAGKGEEGKILPDPGGTAGDAEAQVGGADGRAGRADVGAGAVAGDIVFLPWAGAGSVPLKGYTRWADQRITVNGRFLTIYVSTALLKNGRAGF